MKENDELFDALKNFSQDEKLSKKLSMDDYSLLTSAISRLGKESYHPAKEYLFKLLGHSMLDIVADSGFSLTYYDLNKEEIALLIDKARKVFDISPVDSNSRYVSINTLAGFSNLKDKSLIKFFYKILKDPTVETSIRSCALNGIYNVGSDNTSRSMRTNSVSMDIVVDFTDIDDESEEDRVKFEQYIDWEEINKIVSSIDPDIIK